VFCFKKKSNEFLNNHLGPSFLLDRQISADVRLTWDACSKMPPSRPAASTKNDYFNLMMAKGGKRSCHHSQSAKNGKRLWIFSGLISYARGAKMRLFS
jgi:hypothetical protein